MSNTKPLPCPFCGGEATIDKIATGRSWPDCFVACDTCPTAPLSFGDTLAEAVANWNTRHTPAEVAELVKAARRAAGILIMVHIEEGEERGVTADALEALEAALAKFPTTQAAARQEG